MFDANEKEWFGEIDSEEAEVIRNFESRTYSLLNQLDTQLQESNLAENTNQEIMSQLLEKKKEYLQIVVGIGDKFEGSA